MMIMHIVESTDGQHIGFMFDSSNTTIELPGGVLFQVSKITPLTNGIRFSNSNYVIDAEVVNGQDHQ